MNSVERQLRERAAAIAKKPAQINANSHQEEYIEFRLGSEHYAIAAKWLSDVHKFSQPTRVPYLPTYFLGIVYLRGRFVSVVDLAQFLNIAHDTETSSLNSNTASTDKNIHQTAAHKQSLLLVKQKTIEFCILADEILGKITLAADQLKPLTQGGRFAHPEIILGATQSALTVIHAPHLLEHPAMHIYQQSQTEFRSTTSIQPSASIFADDLSQRGTQNV